MDLTIVLGVGLGIGLFFAAGIFFEPKEPHKVEIFVASTLRSVLVALLTGYSLRRESSLYAGGGYGLLYGFAFGLVVFLAKGGLKSKDAPFVLPVAAISGGLAGVLIALFAFSD